MKIKFLTACMLIAFSLGAYSITYTGANLPFDSLFFMGLVSGPGTGVDIGTDLLFQMPVENLYAGADLQIEITNTEFEQNISIQKYGLALKYNLSEDLFLTAYLGRASFYVSKLVEYTDSLSGSRQSIEEDTHGNGSYWGISPNFRVGEYFISPRVILNNVTNGGNILEVDLNISHRF